MADTAPESGGDSAFAAVKAPPAFSWAGQTIDGHGILKHLGAGGMGQVFLVRHRETGQDVVLKRMPLGDGGAISRFDKEVSVLRTVSGQPNIARILPIHGDIFHGVANCGDGSWLYYLMEFIPGRDLAALRRLDPAAITPTTIRTWWIQTCQALVAAHRADVLHRDLKPQNIMIAPDRGAVVVDWGLGGHGVDRTHLSLAGSTLAWQPPEIITARTGPGTDVFGLAGILLWLYSDRTPLHVLSQESLSPDELAPRLAALLPPDEAALAPILAKGLAKREARTASAAELLSAVRRCWGLAPSTTHIVADAATMPLAGRPQDQVTAMPSAAPPTTAPLTAKPRGRQRLLLGAGVVVAGGIAAALVLRPAPVAAPGPASTPAPEARRPALVVAIPAWATGHGTDAFGTWAEIDLGQGRSYRLRPIAGGMWLGETEVSNGLWAALLGVTAPGPEGVAVARATYAQAQEFLAAVGAKLPGARLPTLAEWLAAAQGTSGGWSRSTASQGPRPVDQGPRAPGGHLNLPGNVWEWVEAPTTGGHRTACGGSVADPTPGPGQVGVFPPAFPGVPMGLRIAVGP